MQTKLIPLYQQREDGQQAEAILRSCVHCGFCNATCPTYQVLGDELDGPRGRIYQIKQMLEGQEVSVETRKHLDRCLTCRACETTCPSGVEYGRLLDIGRSVIAENVPRSFVDQLVRRSLLFVFLSKPLFSSLLRLGQLFKPFLPKLLRGKVPDTRLVRYKYTSDAKRNVRSVKKVLMLDGCVQDALDPHVNQATRLLFTELGFETVKTKATVCCGAMSFHLDEVTRAKQQARQNIDAWWPHIESGDIAGIVVNASGCGVFAKDYSTLLANDSAYAEKAQRVSKLVRDPVELLAGADWSELESELLARIEQRQDRVAFHPPCTLQHGSKLSGRVEAVLAKLGIQTLPIQDSHLCCGSAGTYSIFQSDLAQSLKERKSAAIQATRANVILSANIGCQTHLSTGTDLQVRHWLDYLAELLTEARFR